MPAGYQSGKGRTLSTFQPIQGVVGRVLMSARAVSQEKGAIDGQMYQFDRAGL